MKLIIIYGPPAVGKYSVAKELSSLTGYKLFHNHLTVDLATTIFDYGTPPFWQLVRTMREQIFEAASKENIDLIFTFVFAYGEDEDILNSYFNIVEKNGAEVCLIQLKTSDDVLMQRVEGDSRKAFGKISNGDSLRKYLKKYDLKTSFPNRESYVIDNTDITPLEVATKIREHFHL